MRYRKRPIVIEAFRFGIDFRPDWFCDKVSTNEIITFEDHCKITTLEGVMRGEKGDWIIRGLAGEIYPCKHDIFISSYQEEITEDIIQDMRQKSFFDDRKLNIKVQSYPYNVRTHLMIETNFGEIRFIYDIPPSAEERVGDIIQRTYESLINELYETHQSKGGKFVGDDGCKDYMDKHGKTLLIKEPMLINRK